MAGYVADSAVLELGELDEPLHGGAVRFIYCTTINWIGSATKCQIPVQALILFAELKDGRIRDISRHCIFRTPLDR